MTDINDVYRQRNNLAIAFCKAALAAGWPAGRGVDDTKEPDDEWRHVVYVDLPSGDQVSWHMAPCAVHLLEGLPEYKGKWEGTFTARHKNWPALIEMPKYDCCANCLAPRSRHTENACREPFTTVWHAWDYSVPPPGHK